MWMSELLRLPAPEDADNLFSLLSGSLQDSSPWESPTVAAAAMTYGVGVAQNNADLGGGGGMNDEEYDENSSARLFERSRIKALAAYKSFLH
ncbi:hypothetical protein COOONC_17089 [Cooperia oncophora]